MATGASSIRRHQSDFLPPGANELSADDHNATCLISFSSIKFQLQLHCLLIDHQQHKSPVTTSSTIDAGAPKGTQEDMGPSTNWATSYDNTFQAALQQMM